MIALFIDDLPLGQPSKALTDALANPPAAGYTDIHVHVAGIGGGDSGCFVTDELRKSYKFPFYIRAFGATVTELQEFGDAVVVERLSKHISESKFVKRAVVLALDGVIDSSGALDRAKTQVYVPNEFVVREVAKYPNLLFGASINPYRKDALVRLQRAKEQGAVLVKWIPSLMGIDPADSKLEPFYRELVRLELPLLSHAGQERSFGHVDDSLCDPLKLELPLRLGVTVIAAHIATTGKVDGADNFERIQPLFGRYPKLYSDISSLTQINKLGYLVDALEIPALPEHLLFGTDWPLQMFPLVSPWYHFQHLRAADMQFISRQANQWDRDVLLKKALGVPEEVFTRADSILAVAPAP